MKKNVILVFCFLLLTGGAFAQNQSGGRTTVNFNNGWKFHKGEVKNAQEVQFNDAAWRNLDLPHDWSIEGPFSSEWSSSTGYLPGGTGWYRKLFTIPKSYAGGKVFVNFDGVYNNSEVWINGKYLGKRPNGYISFQYDLTPYLKFGEGNCIAVKVDHSKFGDSRWYTGSGIYRNVRLIMTGNAHLKQWGVFVTTPQVSREQAKMNVEVKVVNEFSKPVSLQVENVLLFGRDTINKSKEMVKVNSASEAVSNQTMLVAKPRLWEVEAPYLYTLVTSVKKDGKLLDHQSIRIGIRELRFDPDKGFFLNGKNTKLKGICLHHEAGCLGAAVPVKVIERRLDLLKEMGCNAIRTSHNEYSSDFLDLCDRKGFLVMDEAFDEWELPKRKWVKGWNEGIPGKDGYSVNFKEWGKKDLSDQILRDRNHSSVIMWSIGNEIDYPNDPYSHPILNDATNPQTFARYNPAFPNANRLGEIARELVAVVKQYDTSRPVTAGLASAVMSNETGYADALDIAGYNYQEDLYDAHHQKYPKRVLYGSETGMSLNAWKAVTDRDNILGQFLWTGIEYLGEAGKYPNHVNTAGVIDLAGHKKTEFYFRQSLWSDKPMVYIGTSDPSENNGPVNLWSHKKAEPIWNWSEGKAIRVSAFTNCEEVELLLNGKSLGSKKMADFPQRVITWDMPFEKGILKAIAKTNGKEVAAYELKTVGAPVQLLALSDVKSLKADKQDVAHIEVAFADQNGNPVYEKNGIVTCDVSGPVRLLGIEDANPENVENYKTNKRTSYKGKVLVYVQSLEKAGVATVKLSSPGLKPVTVVLTVGK
ncbi:MAG: glycoside hydrolase family 2 TIM barrel-domain containing protein [Bacteroidota bacterium]|nr:glycoside hydrolase family 2 TIM barrel-domain containing protein [Bacteroidota bacterium]